MESPWWFQGQSSVVHGRSMDSPRIVHGQFMVVDGCPRNVDGGPWTVHGSVHGPSVEVPVEPPWTVHGLYMEFFMEPPWMDCSWTVHAPPRTDHRPPWATMNCLRTVHGPPWTVHGTNLDCSSTVHGHVMDPRWTTTDVWTGNHHAPP